MATLKLKTSSENWLKEERPFRSRTAGKIDLGFRAMLASRIDWREGMRKALSSIQTLILFACGAAAQEPPARPDLPLVALDDFSSAVRSQIQEAYADVRAHPDDDAAIGRLGMTFQTYGLLQEAAVYYRRASQLAPSTFRWGYYLGMVESTGGHCDAAAATFRITLQIAPAYVPAQLQLANCLLALADWNGSEELYAAIVKQHPDTADAFYGLGRVRAARRDFSGAADAYGQACALFPDFGAAHYALALIHRTLGQDEKAKQQLQLFEKNRDTVPPSNDPLMSEVRALNLSATNQVQIGIELERQGKLEESIAAHEKALELDPKLVQAHVNLIALYGRVGQFDKAEEHYEVAVRLDAGSTEGYYDYGVLLLGRGKYAQAETAFRKTIEIDPFHSGAHNDLGFLLERQGKLQEAAQEYRKAIENGPNSRLAHFNLGRVLVNQHKYTEGIQELTKTLEPKDQDRPRYSYALGAALARSGDRQKALLYLREARDSAEAQGQAGLLTSIERDLRRLEGPGNPR
jgi:tetratricopeptide (TPR) repeat protein